MPRALRFCVHDKQSGANSALNTIGREVGRSLIRGILGSLKRS